MGVQGKGWIGGLSEGNKDLQKSDVPVSGGFLSSCHQPHLLFHRDCSSHGVREVGVKNWLRGVGSKWNEAIISYFRSVSLGGDESTKIYPQVEYNPGTGFLTDNSGLVLHYHRRDELQPVGRLLVSSTDEDSTLCASSCLSSQV